MFEGAGCKSLLCNGRDASIFIKAVMKVELLKLKNSWIEDEYFFEDDNSSLQKTLKIRTRDGWRMMDSPYDPVREAREIVGSVADDCSRVLLIGAGSGYVVEALLQKNFNEIMLITPYRVIAERNAALTAKYPNGGNRLFLIVVDVFDERVRHYVNGFLENSDPAKIIVHPRECRTSSEIFNPLTVYVSSLRKQVIPLPAQQEINRVLFPGSGQIIEKEIIRALRKKGAEVIPVNAYSEKRVDVDEAVALVAEVRPDLVLSTNNKGSDRNGFVPSACANANVGWATWFLDDPRFIISKNEVCAGQKRYGFCWDHSGIAALNEIGFSDPVSLPLATDPELFYPGDGVGALEGRVVYVGSPGFGNEKQYFSGLEQKRGAAVVCEYFEDRVFRQRCLPSADEMRQALAELKIERTFSLSELARLPAYVMYRANLKYRIRAIRKLSALNPVVFGRGWEGLLPSNVTLRPYADYYRELPRIYRSDAIHLSLTHLQMYHYPNQRVFDAGACGSAVLGDHVSGWDELFDPPLEELMFNDFSEMKEKAALLVKDKNRRQDLGRCLRQQVLAKHTYQHRINTMIDVLTGRQT